MNIAVCEDDSSQRENIREICDSFFSGMGQEYQYMEYADGAALRPEQLKLVGALGSAFGVVFLCICIWQIYTYNSREQTEKENRLYENYLRMQERYTHTLIDADRNMRKFRHDFRAHALAIKGHA